MVIDFKRLEEVQKKYSNEVSVHALKRLVDIALDSDANILSNSHIIAINSLKELGIIQEEIKHDAQKIEMLKS